MSLRRSSPLQMKASTSCIQQAMVELLHSTHSFMYKTCVIDVQHVSQAQRLCTSSAVAHDTSTAPRMELQPAGSNCLDYVDSTKPARRISTNLCRIVHACTATHARCALHETGGQLPALRRPFTVAMALVGPTPRGDLTAKHYTDPQVLGMC